MLSAVDYFFLTLTSVHLRRNASFTLSRTLTSTCCAQVGAALSMVYTSGAPIMFCGVGQTYVDLKRLNVKSVVRSLLK